MTLSIDTIRQALSDGLLSFPVTDFDENGKFNASNYEKRIASFVNHNVSAIFVAGGTGEFFSLSLEEYKQVVEIAVRTVDGRIPVFASTGKSIVEAHLFAKAAEQAGCDGLLLMPPYLTECPQAGLIDYAKNIINNTSLQVIYYNRANGQLGPQSVEKLANECPNLIGLKDGVGNIAVLNDTIRSVGNRLVYIGGVPTAEIFAEAYLAIGVNTYSSAVFNFVPDLAQKFYHALRAGEQQTCAAIIKNFFIPFCRLRDHVPGYGVSLIKSGTAIMGHPSGNTRPPLTMPTATEYKELETIIKNNL